MPAWSQEKCLGFAFAATLNADRSLTRVAGHVPEDAREQAQALLATLEGTDAAHKMRVLRAMAERVRGELSGEQLPPRARALLARSLPKALGRTFLEGAPQARHDFSLAPEVEATLRHFATLSPTDGDASRIHRS